jgi:CRP/FNR family transcriptional regulator
MKNVHVSKAFASHSVPTELQSTMGEANQGAKTPLWSTLKEVFDLLHISSNFQGISQDLRFQHVHFRTGQHINTIGQNLQWLFAVNSGFLKTAAIDEFGNEQIIGFPMRGDILGADSISSLRFPSETVALSECNLILIPFHKLVTLAHENLGVQNAIFCILSRELQNRQAMINMLGKPNAETRVARFLVYLAERYGELGYSKSMFNLKMTRQDIGSYLGLSLETISRALSALNDAGLIRVEQRSIWIMEHAILKSMQRIPSAKARQKSSNQKPFAFANWTPPSIESVGICSTI